VWQHAVIIDAGSTGSRAHVFRYRTAGGQDASYPIIDLPEAVHKASPGLSSYALDPKAAAQSLQPLIRFAKAKVGSLACSLLKTIISDVPEAWAQEQLMASACSVECSTAAAGSLHQLLLQQLFPQ